ncbi:hypothetical protein HX802_04775 [Marine Group I thaumarchaeote]|uniref:Peptidase n=1 Tax=Marine Group I thaumarchaeote TaxID=2511932 RepID=A0A7K4NFM6_9ARCH|nr:hypothetical protein [Marine Group I thaumarchaeote]
MKIAGILLLLLVMLSILPSLGLTFAAPTISIETSQSVYEYGDHLEMIINVAEITGDDARIYITDPAERKSFFIQQPISQKYVEFPSRFPFDSAIWKPGTYVLELEYSGDKSSTQFTIEDTGKIALPFWIKDLAKMWINEPLVTDKDFARAIEYLIQREIIKIPYTEPGEETISSIPEWVKNNAGWWIEGKISDTEFTMALQYLVKTGIITVNLSKA